VQLPRLSLGPYTPLKTGDIRGTALGSGAVRRHARAAGSIGVAGARSCNNGTPGDNRSVLLASASLVRLSAALALVALLVSPPKQGQRRALIFAVACAAGVTAIVIVPFAFLVGPSQLWNQLILAPAKRPGGDSDGGSVSGLGNRLLDPVGDVPCRPVWRASGHFIGGRCSRHHAQPLGCHSCTGTTEGGAVVLPLRRPALRANTECSHVTSDRRLVSTSVSS
jgi:hypothetical protein